MTIEKRTKEYYEGQEAAANGLDDDENPYNFGTEEAIDWDLGWFESMGYGD